MVDEPVRIEFDLIVAVRFDTDEKCFYASSPNIDIVRDGATGKEALDMFLEALDIFVESAYSNGTLELLLARGGYVCKRCFTEDKLQLLRFELEPPAQTFGNDFLTEQASIHLQRYSHNTNESGKQLCRV